jgi:(1->4)-alpha-D-glucan 1-alpha-D-glucosylmutase
LLHDVDGQPAPSRNDEYLFYQTLIGVWPLQIGEDREYEDLIERIVQYMEKATHEAKLRTSWIAPDPDYNQAVQQFVRAALRRDPKNRFLADFREFHETVLDAGLYTALSQVLLKLTSPGAPDIYQGQELWDFSLVDPDNRRPVDFAQRRQLLQQFEAQVASGPAGLHELACRLARTPRDPRLKFFATWRTLQFRQQQGELFQRGRYVPLEVEGARAEHLCAFARHLDAADGQPEQIAIVVVPRLLAGLASQSQSPEAPAAPLGAAVWEDTCIVLPDAMPPEFQNWLTGQAYPADEHPLPVARILADFPVALLTVR